MNIYPNSNEKMSDKSETAKFRVHCPKCNHRHFFEAGKEIFRCRNCIYHCEMDDAITYSMKDNSIITTLAEVGPRTGEEIEALGGLGGNEKFVVERIVVTSGGQGGYKRRRSDTHREIPIYYLPGQERKAVSRYIQENESSVRSSLKDKANPLNHNLESWMYNLIKEQWYWLGYDGK